MLKKIFCLFLLINLVNLINFVPLVLAGPQSTTYELKQFGFGSGGTENSNSTSFSLFGVSGESDADKINSTNYTSENGLTFTQVSNVPPAPAFTNANNYYNKLSITLNTASNPSDSKFAIAISTDNFVTDTKYVQSDDTIGNTLGPEDWQTNSVWGSSGFNVIGLLANTTYTIKVKSKQGNYTESGWGPTAQASTVGSQLTFILTTDSQPSAPFSIGLGNLTPGSVITASNKGNITVSTNTASGVNIYLTGSNAGLRSTVDNYTISAVSTNLTAATEGYGARATTTSQSSGGPMEILTPFNGSGNVVGTIDTTKRLIFDSTGNPVTSGTGSFELKAKASNVTPAANDYTDTLTIIAVPAY